MSRFTIDDLKQCILFEDKDLLVLYKPAGIAVQHASFGQIDLESVLKHYLVMQQNQKGVPFLGVIHRLDQPVEGVLVFAKTKDAARGLNQQLTSGKMDKRYLAVVEGVCRASEEELHDYLLKDGKIHRSSVVDRAIQGAKEARLKYRLIEQRENEALVEIRLFTGRHHQIRVQMSHAGMPLIGDRKYHPDTKESKLRLCAYSLRFYHPRTGKQMVVRIPKERLDACYQGLE